MKPLGQYPSLAEYKSVGIKPPPHYVIKESKLLVPRDGSDTPLTSAEDALLSDISFMDEVEVEVEPEVKTPPKTGSSSRFKRALLNMDNSLIHDFTTPISESFEIFTSHPSSSPKSRTPMDSLDPRFHSTMSTPALPTEPKSETSFLDTLRSLPVPESSKYNVLRLRAALESAVTDSINEGNDQAALSLVFFWADLKLSGDDFKLALIDNMGKSDDVNHHLEVVLKTILRHSTVGAASWYESFIIEQDSLQKGWVSESDKMAAKAANFVEPQTTSTSRKAVSSAEIYRDTSGPRLEEAFLSGKTNTAPLKRAKKPCPADELPYKRRQTWDADPDTGTQVQIKRARASEDVIHANVSPEEESFLRGTDHEDMTRPLSPVFSEFSGFPPSVSDLSNSAYSDTEIWTGDQPPRIEFVIRGSDDEDDELENSDVCRNCDKGGFLICCENCENSFHAACCNLDGVPTEDVWLCPKCSTHSIFTTLINKPIHPRKTEYSVPTEIKTYFEGVGEGRQCDTHYATDLRNQSWYKRVPHIPRLTKQPKQKGPTPLYSDPNLTKLVDNGHAIFCTRCGKGSDNVYPIIRCDFCTCRFHLDCLDPPRAHPPNPFDGWMCPNHVDPDGMVSRKMVNGEIHESRIRIPKHASAALNDPDATLLVDQDESDTNSEEQNDFILSFIGGVKDKAALRQLEKTLQAEQRLLKAQKALEKEKSEISGIKAQAAFMASIQEEQRVLAIQKQKLDEAKKFVSDCILSFDSSDSNAHARLQAQLDNILEGMKLDNIRSMEAAAIDGLLELSSSG